jgi:hypothetical protein
MQCSRLPALEFLDAVRVPYSKSPLLSMCMCITSCQLRLQIAADGIIPAAAREAIEADKKATLDFTLNPPPTAAARRDAFDMQCHMQCRHSGGLQWLCRTAGKAALTAPRLGSRLVRIPDPPIFVIRALVEGGVKLSLDQLVSNKATACKLQPTPATCNSTDVQHTPLHGCFRGFKALRYTCANILHRTALLHVILPCTGSIQGSCCRTSGGCISNTDDHSPYFCHGPTALCRLLLPRLTCQAASTGAGRRRCSRTCSHQPWTWPPTSVWTICRLVSWCQCLAVYAFCWL